MLVKHFTKFTKDIFASLVALLFIFEALRKLSVVSTYTCYTDTDDCQQYHLISHLLYHICRYSPTTPWERLIFMYGVTT